MGLVDYSFIQSNAIAALNAAGKTCVYRSKGGIVSGSDEFDPEFEDPTDTDIIALAYKPTVRDSQGNLVYKNTHRALVKIQDDLTIEPSGQIAFDIASADVVNTTRFHEIVDFQLFKPGDTPIFWELEVMS